MTPHNIHTTTHTSTHTNLHTTAHTPSTAHHKADAKPAVHQDATTDAPADRKMDVKADAKAHSLTFSDMVTDPKILKAINDLGFKAPTEIQALTIPAALKGKDLIGQAKTGSGKTIAFGVPLLHNLTSERRAQALILAPTRELCQQITVELGKLARYNMVKIASVFGGVSINPQIAALRDAQVVVATPGRLMDHLERGTFHTGSIKFLVFDEADRMFDMGFLKDMERITKRLPTDRQTLLFSATMPEAIRRLTAHYQRSPVHIKASTQVEEHLLPQFSYRVNQADKFSLLIHLLKKENPNLAIIFCQTKHGAKSLAKNIAKQGFECDAMHGNLSQAQRDKVITDFKRGKLRFLVATDIAARGLDVKHVTHVFNYEVSKTADDYVHRIGRTARAGQSGKAISFVDPSEHYAWRDILRLPNVHVTEMPQEPFERIVFEKQPRGERSSSPRSRFGQSSSSSRGSSSGGPSYGRSSDRPSYGRSSDRPSSGYSSSDRPSSLHESTSSFVKRNERSSQYAKPSYHQDGYAKRDDAPRREYSSSHAPSHAHAHTPSHAPSHSNFVKKSDFAKKPDFEKKSYGSNDSSKESGDRSHSAGTGTFSRKPKRRFHN